jgi:hypothetical protein
VAVSPLERLEGVGEGEEDGMTTTSKLLALAVGWAASVVLASVVAFAVGRSSYPQDQQGLLSGRTYYESLDLSSPEAAVGEFCAAFRRSDYATVYLVLTPRTQFILDQQMTLLRWGKLVREEAAEDVVQELCVASEGLGNCDYEGEMMFWFDELMLGAEKHSAFLIDLRGREHISGRRPATTDEGYPAIDVTATVEGISGEVAFRTVQIPSSGKWRVFQVVVPGGNEEFIPWSVPSAE